MIRLLIDYYPSFCKSILVKSLPENGLAVLNVDNEIIRELRDQIGARVVDFGINSEAKIYATDIQFSYDEVEKKNRGLSFKLNYEGSFVPIRLPHIIARHHIYAALAAVAVGNHFKINLVEMAKSLEALKPPQGRMSPIEGIKGSLVIDDTYNSSPVSARAALETVEACESVSEQCCYPLHVGVTEAGVGVSAIIHSWVGVGALLNRGLCDTIRISLTESPALEVVCGHLLLTSMGLR